MGNEESWCGRMESRMEQQHQLNETVEQDFQKINTDAVADDPLHSFIGKSASLKIKTLNKIREEQQNEVEDHQDTIEETIVKRIRRKTIQMSDHNAEQEILKLLEEEIEKLALEHSVKGFIINKDDIDRQKVFKKLKINIANFIKTNGENVSKYYSFKECIGQGSYGKVFRAICKRTKQQRAIKVLKHKMNGKQDASFLAEINLLTQLDHPNIVKLYQIYYYKSFYYVVMEYCKGGSIIQLIKKVKKFSEAMVAHIMKQLLSALTYLHKQHIIHRDIKLDNIVFLDKLDQTNTKFNFSIKIIDFGTAIRLDQKKKKIAGTRYYMAPEAFKGFLHEKSDVWSCGVFLFLFFTGKFPFKGKNVMQVEHEVNTKTISFAQNQWKNVTLEAKKMILGMLERNVDKRFTSFQALNHPWLKRCSISSQVSYNEWNLQRLDKYQRGNNLIAIIESYLSLKEINQDEREKLAQIFREIDINNDGSIECEQLVKIYQEHFGVHTEEEVGKIMERIDHNQSGKIDFNQFLVAMYTRKKLFFEDSLTNAFKHYDLDHDGYLAKEELRKLLQGCEREQIEYVLSQLDTDRDSKVSLTEFLCYMHKFD